MPIFSRGFLFKPKAIGVIAAPGFQGVIETIDNVAVASYTLTSAEAQSVSQSGSATLALTVEATREPVKDNSAASSQSLGIDALAETESNSASSSQTITLEKLSESDTNSGSSTLALTAEVTVEPNKDNQGTTSTTLGVDATGETESNSGGAPQQNLNTNGDFEVDTSGWSNYSAATLSRDTNEHKYGVASLKIVSTGTADYGAQKHYGAGPNNVGVWTHSAWVKGEGGSIGKTIRIYIQGSWGTNSPGFTLTGNWQRISVTSGIFTGEQINTFIIMDPPSTIGDTFYVDGDRVEQGVYATGPDNQTIVEGEYDILTNVGGTPSGGTYGSGTYGSGGYGAGSGENQTIVEAVAETTTNSATSTQTFSVEAIAETVNNSATSSQAIGESIVTPSIADTLDNTATSSQTLYVDATSEAEAQSGSASQALTVEAIREPNKDNQGTATTTLGIDATAETENNGGSGTQVITDSASEIEANTGTGTHSFTEAIAESVANIGTNTQVLDEVEFISNTGVVTPGISEAIAESPQNSATATILISDFQTESEVNTGTGAPTIAEATSEAVNNSASNTQAITDQVPETNMTNQGTGSQLITEVIVEPIVVNIQSSSQTITEALAETGASSGTATHTITALETDTTTNGGSGSHNIGEATAETDDNSGSNDPEYDESTHITVVPFSDITTGTWTVAPLYEKIDEFYPVSGYPTESIRSGSNPVNDKAVVGLAPVSDPGVDSEHYINVQFWKGGAETLDFVVNFMEGNTLIATRTFTNVTETQANPRVERIALTTGEISGIVDYSNLRVELIANQTS